MFPANTEDALRRALCPVEYIEMPAVFWGTHLEAQSPPSRQQ